MFHEMSIALNGLATGLLLQLAIGPVFFFITTIAMQQGVISGLAAVAAATFVDYLYIALSLMGLGKLLEQKKIKTLFGEVSSLVLILFGILMIKGALGGITASTPNPAATSVLHSFVSTFLLTLSSPMGIVFWTGVFTAKAVEYNYTKRELFIFGLATGLATLLFMGIAVLVFAFIKGVVPPLLIVTLNVIVGSLLIGYGVTRLVK